MELECVFLRTVFSTWVNLNYSVFSVFLLSAINELHLCNNWFSLIVLESLNRQLMIFIKLKPYFVLNYLFNCSQTKFVAIILVLSVFFLCDFSLDRFFV